VRQPGLQLIIPLVDRMTEVPVQTIVLDVPAQGAITRDNVTVSVTRWSTPASPTAPGPW
jgi:regulator of protease activity HflC (stomatin/prohibitin superfamily)